MSNTPFLWLPALWLVACSSTVGDPIAAKRLGYRECEKYFDCGPGRYCCAEGTCWSDCRTSADCVLYAKGDLCNLFGECVERGGTRPCTSHADCGANGYCNGRCGPPPGRAVCGQDSDCPCLFGVCEKCQGTCAPQCASDNDCLGFGDQLECTPVGQCLLPGWERWVSPGELPPTTCRQDSHCLSLGFAWRCDCPKTPDAKSGIPRCSGGTESVCIPLDEPLDFGDGPASSPAHAFRGVWGMRMEIGVVTLGLPLINSQNTYSSNLFLVQIRHTAGDTLQLTEKLCELKLINFIDSDEAFEDIAWMVTPHRFLKAAAVLQRTVEVPSAEPGAAWTTSRTNDLRGCVLNDPYDDPLPDRHDFDANPDDERFWDQDEDGHVSMTMLMDGVLRGAVYIVQRWQATCDGQILDADHVRGPARVENEQLIISASTPGLIYDTSTKIHEDADRTYFRMQRLSEDASCADLIRLASRDDAWLRHTPHMMDVPDP